jgi:predicted GNAT family N-acyltransferase
MQNKEVTLPISQHWQIRVAVLPDDFPLIQAIRIAVFQQEQGIAPALEFDGKDATATQILAYLEDQPVGTARFRVVAPGVAKLERLAVLPQARGCKLGQQIVKFALKEMAKTQIHTAIIHAQTTVQRFYEKLGFTPEGEQFEEAGIAHIKMRCAELGRFSSHSC